MAGAVQVAQKTLRVGVEGGVGHAGLAVEVDDVEVRPQLLLPKAHPFALAPNQEGHTQINQTGHALRMHDGQGPDDERPPVVTDEQSVFIAEVVEQGGEVSG